jgi:hypothetical protein
MRKTRRSKRLRSAGIVFITAAMLAAAACGDDDDGDGALFEGLRQRWRVRVDAGFDISPQQITVTHLNCRWYVTLTPARSPGFVATLAQR